MGLCKPVMGAWWVTCSWASVSQFLPHNSATPVLGLDDYADGCLFEKGAAQYPFCLGRGTGRGVGGGGVPQGCPPHKVYVPSQKSSLLSWPTLCIRGTAGCRCNINPGKWLCSSEFGCKLRALSAGSSY